MSIRRYGNRQGRKTKREEILSNNAVHKFYAACSDNPRAQEALAKYTKEVPPPRAPRMPSGKPLEKAVNEAISDLVNGHDHVHLWRNNRGIALQGERVVRYGVGPNGASDWIGYRELLVTADMIGKSVAQFVAIEAKRPGEKPDERQQKFIDQVNKHGGIAGSATSREEADEILGRWGC